MTRQPHPSVTLDAAAATALLSAAGPASYTLVGPLAGGETGATQIRRADGTPFVLKWEDDLDNQQRRRQGAHLAERLRTEAGWPSPAQDLLDIDGTLVIVQEFLPGGNVGHLSHTIVDSILELHHARLGLAAFDDDNGKWGTYLLRMLTVGGNGYCLHEPLHRFDARTRNVIERFEEIGHSTDPSDLAGHDIIHFDLHPGNLLQVDGRLTAVVDMDYARRGDATFDLTTLAVASLGVTCDPGVRIRIFDEGVEALPAPKRGVYLANLLLRNLDWSIRKSRLDEIEFWLAETERLLPD